MGALRQEVAARDVDVHEEPGVSQDRHDDAEGVEERHGSPDVDVEALAAAGAPDAAVLRQQALGGED